MEFFSVSDSYELQDTKRILVYPNITWKRDLSQDSFVQVISQDIASLNEKRDDLWFYIPVTERTSMLDFENVTQLRVNYPSYPNSMRTHFDFFDHYEYLGQEYDFDLVYSHLPEHTLQLKNLIVNKTHHSPAFFGYCHWFEFEEVTDYEERILPMTIMGILKMEHCYVNTVAQKELAIEEASEWFNSDVIQSLNEIMEPFYLGVDESEIISTEDINKSPNKVIVFNHRPQEYKNFSNFLSICDKLREKRDDFKVWIPLLESSDRDYVYCDEWPKSKYYRHLNKCCVGFGPKQVYRGWSMSALDGLKNGLPFIFYDAKYYHELWDDADFFSDNEEALNLLEKYLDNFDYRNKKALDGLNYCRSNLLHSFSVDGLNRKIDSYLKSQKRMSEDSEALKRIKEYIKEEGVVSKEKIIKWLNWGVQIPWTPYRRAILDDENFHEVKGPTPKYIYD